MNVIDKIIKLNKDIWGKRYWNNKKFAKILELQIEEMRKEKYSTVAVTRELMDILNMSFDFLANNVGANGTQITKYLLLRAETRYRGKTDKIIRKYRRKIKDV